jgi:hypothetical protein
MSVSREGFGKDNASAWAVQVDYVVVVIIRRKHSMIMSVIH